MELTILGGPLALCAAAFSARCSEDFEREVKQRIERQLLAGGGMGPDFPVVSAPPLWRTRRFP